MEIITFWFRPVPERPDEWHHAGMPAPFSPLPGDPDQVAGYQIAGRLGSGGQGVVYLGIAPSGERAAVKMLRFHDEDSHAQFAKEVASARRVAPFCTAQLLDYDLDVAAPT